MSINSPSDVNNTGSPLNIGGVIPELELDELLDELELLEELEDELLLEEELLELEEVLVLDELFELDELLELEELELIGTIMPELELDELLELEVLLELDELDAIVPELELEPELDPTAGSTVIFTVSDALAPAALVMVS